MKLRHEQEYRSGEIDDIVDMPLLLDSNGHVTMSAIENVGMGFFENGDCEESDGITVR